MTGFFFSFFHVLTHLFKGLFIVLIIFTGLQCPGFFLFQSSLTFGFKRGLLGASGHLFFMALDQPSLMRSVFFKGLQFLFGQQRGRRIGDPLVCHNFFHR